jgi:hypothetical protein
MVLKFTEEPTNLGNLVVTIKFVGDVKQTNLSMVNLSVPPD